MKIHRYEIEQILEQRVHALINFNPIGEDYWEQIKSIEKALKKLKRIANIEKHPPKS